MPKGYPLQLTGKQFGEWKVLGRSQTHSKGHALWECRCSCGRVSDVQTGNLTSGRSTRCRACGTAGRKKK